MEGRPRLRPTTRGQGGVDEPSLLERTIAAGKAEIKRLRSEPETKFRNKRIAELRRAVARTRMRLKVERNKREAADLDAAWREFHARPKQCFFCGTSLHRDGATLARGVRVPGHWPTRDHLIPRSRGGPTHPFNLVHACYDCNTRKSNRTLEEFREDEMAAGHPGVFWGEREIGRRAA